MWRFGYDANATFILTIALLSMLGTVLVWQKQRTGKTIHVWFWSAFFGVLLGCTGTYALTRITQVKLLQASATSVASESEDATPPAAGGSEGAMAGPGGRTEPGGRFGGPRPKRDLTSLVRKVALLTGDVEIVLSAPQASALVAALEDVESSKTMSDDEAQAKHDELLALFDNDQKTLLDAVALPRRRPSGGPGSFERPAEDANPFEQEVNSAALDVLRNRFADKASPEKN